MKTKVPYQVMRLGQLELLFAVALFLDMTQMESSDHSTQKRRLMKKVKKDFLMPRQGSF